MAARKQIDELRELLLWARRERIVLSQVTLGPITVTIERDHGITLPSTPELVERKPNIYEQYAGTLLPVPTRWTRTRRWKTMTRPPREAYWRGYAMRDGFECTVGIEKRAGDNPDEWTNRVKRMAIAGAIQSDHHNAERTVEDTIVAVFPDRAYFVETERDGAGIQVYQPLGMPRNKETPSP
jgi:hypothetical protein